jgi:Flp pilus assembly protein TadG
MSARRRHLIALSDERGSILVVAMLISAVLVLLGTVIIEVGHTMAHRRHLQVQTDAAALAAAQEFPLCSTNPAGAYGAMSTIADQYGGFNGANQYNQQVGTKSGYAGTVSALYQSRPYPAGGTAIAQDPDNIFNGTTQEMTCGTSDPSSIKFFDVKATEAGVHDVFNFGLSTTVHAHSRVELKAVNELNGLLPLGVPDVRPNYVFAKFIAESGTVTCTDLGNVPVPSCEEELIKGNVSGSQQQWVPASTLKVTIPVGDLGVRIRVVGGTDKTAPCGAQFVECYDETNTALGLIHIRGWDPAAAAPVVKDASLINGSCTPDAYFTSGDCLAGITADIDLGTINASTKVWATVDGAGNYPLTTPTMSGNGVKTWTSANVIPVTGAGPHPIALKFAIDGTGSGTALGTVQRAYEADPDSSGPLFLVQEYDAGANSVFGPYSYQGGTTHTLGVTVNTQGTLLLSAKTDPPIGLRLFKSGGSASQNQTIDCDPNISNLEQEIASGCAPTYKTQTSLTCPFTKASTLWASPQPWTCAAIQTGASIGNLNHGLNQRIYGSNNPPASACNPGGYGGVLWIRNEGFNQIKFPDDKRMLALFVVPLGSFQGTGNEVVPVIDFGFFYVTGYSGDPCAGVDPNDDPVTSGASVVGHFIKFFPIDDHHTSDDNCNLNTITPCVGVLTR